MDANVIIIIAILSGIIIYGLKKTRGSKKSNSSSGSKGNGGSWTSPDVVDPKPDDNPKDLKDFR